MTLRVNNRFELELAGEVFVELDAALAEIRNPRSEASFDERWMAFCDLINAGVFNKIDPYYGEALETLDPNATWYDHLGTEGRGEEVNFSDMLDLYENYGGKPTEEKVIAFKEYCFKSGYSGATNDW